jgi:hypothetical protein
MYMNSALRGEHILKAYENGVLRRIFELKWEVSAGCTMESSTICAHHIQDVPGGMCQTSGRCFLC